ncbi:MAG TPA: AbrB/MazE/SpoVT family DNA-binding domain-containing protein [Azospirillaceae bacterium]|nr:AbrB/MazE/SpoVT family DNA-binding domain-containing protein [Azospirillaceae bacterium]
MPSQTIRMTADGELVIPACFRAELGLKEGGVLSARVENGSLYLDPPDVALRRLQEKARSSMREHQGRASEELIAERRREAERD